MGMRTLCSDLKYNNWYNKHTLKSVHANMNLSTVDYLRAVISSCIIEDLTPVSMTGNGK